MRPDRFPVWVIATAEIVFFIPNIVSAQGTPADYARANGLKEKYESAAIDIAGPASWIGETNRFWYRKLSRGVNEFIVVDAETLKKQPAFDQEKIAASLAAVTGNSYKADQLPLNFINFDPSGSSFFTFVDGTAVRCTLVDSVCQKAGDGRGGGELEGSRQRQEGPRVSPDHKWEAVINNYNVAIRRKGSHDLIFLSTDGSEGNHYDLASIEWSPDSTKLAAYRVKPGYNREVHYVSSSPEDQLQPENFTIRYEKPGDVLDLDQPVLFDVAMKKQTNIDNTLFPNPYAMSELVWRQDSRAFTFEYNQRGHQAYRVIEVDAATGKPRAVISEEPKTFFNYREANGSRLIPARNIATMWTKAKKSSGCPNAKDGITCTSLTVLPARSKTKSPGANGWFGEFSA